VASQFVLRLTLDYAFYITTARLSGTRNQKQKGWLSLIASLAFNPDILSSS